MNEQLLTDDLGFLVDTPSRKLWSRLKAELEKPDVVVAGNLSRPNAAQGKRDYLCTQLAIVRATHSRALPSILKGLVRSELLLAAGQVVFAGFRNRPNRHVKPSVLNVLSAELLEPLREALQGFLDLAGHGKSICQTLARLPLVGRLKDVETTKLLVHDIQVCIRVLESQLESDASVDDAIFLECLESLDAVQEALAHTTNCWPTEVPRWCKHCFRRAAPGFLYCRLHYPCAAPDRDKEYRRGKRAYKYLGDQAVYMVRHRALRRAMREPALLFGFSDAPQFDVSSRGMLVPDPIKEFLDFSYSSADWPQAAKIWDQFLQHRCPLLLLNTRCRPASEYASWHDFVAGIQRALQNPDEKTTDPLWILLSLMDAEAWFQAETTCVDRRLTGTRENILAMHSEGKLKQIEIATQLSISRQFVSRVICQAD